MQGELKHIALFTIDGHGEPLAYHMQEQGIDVHVGVIRKWPEGYKHEENAESLKRRLSLYDGMFEHKTSSNELISKLLAQKNKQDWFVICDFNHEFVIADIIRKAGFSGFLPTQKDAELEKDRKLAKELVAKRYEMVTVGECNEFKKIKEGIKFLSDNKESLYVLKGFSGEAPTIVPYSDEYDVNREFLINGLERHRKLYESEGYILEEKIPDIVEFTPQAMAYDGKVVAVTVDIEHKLMGSRSGIQTGCGADCVFWLEKGTDTKMYEWFLKPLEDMMLRQNQLTVWDMSVLYSPSRKKYYFGEFCSNRFGFNAVFTENAIAGSTVKYFSRAVSQKEIFQKGTSKKFGTSIRVFNLVPSNTHIGCMSSGDLILCDKDGPNVWLWDVEEEDGNIYTVGFDKNTLIVTGTGNTLEQSVSDCFSNLKEVNYDSGYHLEAQDILNVDNPQSILSRLGILQDLDLY